MFNELTFGRISILRDKKRFWCNNDMSGVLMLNEMFDLHIVFLSLLIITSTNRISFIVVNKIT